MIREYILLAVGCVALGIVFAILILVISQRMGIDFIYDSLWVLAIPAILSLTINIGLLELYRKFRKRK